jgi:senataxin
MHKLLPGLTALLVQPRKSMAAAKIPRITVPNSPKLKQLVTKLKDDHNSSQWKAIQSSLSDQRIVLLQGPPGTGKTRTVVSIVTLFLEATAGENKEPRKRPRVFVCAPSNAAADEIALRLIESRGNYDVNDVKVGIPVVRVGDPNSVRQQVRSIHLDALIEQRLTAAGAKNGKLSAADLAARTKQQEEQRRLSELIGQLHAERQQLEKKGHGRGTEEHEALTAKLSAAHTKKDELVGALNLSFGAERRARVQARERRARAKLEILNRAEVICCTLSGSGSDALHEVRNVVGESQSVLMPDSPVIPTRMLVNPATTREWLTPPAPAFAL